MTWTMKDRLATVNAENKMLRQTAKDCHKTCEKLREQRVELLAASMKEIDKLKEQKENIMKAKVKMFKGCVIEPFNSEIKRLEQQLAAKDRWMEESQGLMRFSSQGLLLKAKEVESIKERDKKIKQLEAKLKKNETKTTG